MSKKKSCNCEDDYLILSAYWLSAPAWLYLHPGVHRDYYYIYRNRCKERTKEFFGVYGEWLKNNQNCNRNG